MRSSAKPEAKNFRPDLASAGLGNSGFIIKLHRSIDPLYLPFIIVKLDGGDAELPRAPTLGFAEFFSSFHASHPAAGRNRTLVGVFWPDRTDAAFLRRGKTSIGLIPADFPALDSLINTGLAILPPGRRVSESAFRANPHDNILDFLETREMLLLLRAILDDNPLVIAPTWHSTEQGFSQPSSRNPSPSPAECIE